MIDDGLIVDFRSHLSLIAPNGVPIKLVAFDLVDFASRAMSDPSRPAAVDFHASSIPSNAVVSSSRQATSAQWTLWDSVSNTAMAKEPRIAAVAHVTHHPTARKGLFGNWSAHCVNPQAPTIAIAFKPQEEPAT
uniref:hypothetical protein n=1 Tax=Agrobacterium fabrum TaxID=1176649 RepID=UPI00155DD0EE|nr:hypothetical protein [Agrobacterium fabrum]